MAAPCLTGESVLTWRRKQLRLGGVASALDWLLDLEGGVSWQALQQLRLEPNSTVNLAVPLERLEAIWQRHCNGQEPLQYLVGRCPWRDLNLRVAPGVLIPRKETELLVDLALHTWSQHSGYMEPRLWADLGTGSGCLAVALARAWPRGKGCAVDRSAEALQQAIGGNRSSRGGGSWNWSCRIRRISPRRFGSNWILWCATTNQPSLWWVEMTAWRPCGRLPRKRHWPSPRGGGCCWSITMTRAMPWRRCYGTEA